MVTYTNTIGCLHTPHRTTLHVNVQGVGNKHYVITDAILKDDLGVGKVGHRATILAACVPPVRLLGVDPTWDQAHVCSLQQLVVL